MTRSYSDVKDCEGYHPRIKLIAEWVESEIAENGKKRTAFDGSAIQLTVKDFLIRLVKYGYCSQPVYVVMIILVVRLLEKGIKLTTASVHRVLLPAFVVAAKQRDDIYYSNRYYAQVGGISTKELNTLEHLLLSTLDWELAISPECFTAAKEAIDASDIGSLKKLPPLPTPPKPRVAARVLSGGKSTAIKSPTSLKASSHSRLSLRKQSDPSSIIKLTLAKSSLCSSLPRSIRTSREKKAALVL
eukprot:TRINITY_DN5744_c1_g1_i1.p1 TRINITY_DN5744_c1_g1~~TRINITY_DN5744_c1_g1_i1.p1  ORF type:complete len:244 (+),score=37.10 TRINITY_DN5744_c1_g1_i1:138-869(+)